MEIAEVIRERRTELGMSQRDLAQAAGVDVRQIRRYEAGEQPLEKVEPEISNKLYESKMEPGLRTYLTTLREDSYLQIKPGYTDTAAVKAEPIEEVAATPEKDDSNKTGHKFGILPKKKSGT